MSISTPTVTRDQAEAVIEAIKAKFPAYCMTFPTVNGRHDFDGEPVPAPDDELPRLVENYAWSDREPAVPFAVIWNDGPSDWALIAWGDADVDVELTAELQDFAAGKVVRHRTVKQPAGVFCEAITGSVLGIYPV